jgi:hypothetical protein
VTRLLLLLLAGAPAIGVAQAPIASTTLRFGIAYAAATPTGAFRDYVAPPSGFATWAALPLSRTSPLGVRAEFSILTIPEERATSLIAPGVDLDVSVRSTVGFTGVGPRLETSLGPLVVAGAVMGGLSRFIVDVNGRVEIGPQVLSVGISQSEQAPSMKATLDAYLPLYFGRQDAAIGLTAGLDWRTSTTLTVLRSGSFALDGDRLLQEEAESAVTMWGWRVGVGLFF